MGTVRYMIILVLAMLEVLSLVTDQVTAADTSREPFALNCRVCSHLIHAPAQNARDRKNALESRVKQIKTQSMNGGPSDELNNFHDLLGSASEIHETEIAKEKHRENYDEAAKKKHYNKHVKEHKKDADHSKKKEEGFFDKGRKKKYEHDYVRNYDGRMKKGKKSKEGVERGFVKSHTKGQRDKGFKNKELKNKYGFKKTFNNIGQFSNYIPSHHRLQKHLDNLRSYGK